MPVIKYKDTDGTVKELGLIAPMDASLSDDSVNGVQNKVIKAALDARANIPPCPTTTDGTFILQCVVSGGTPTYSWVTGGASTLPDARGEGF